METQNTIQQFPRRRQGIGMGAVIGIIAAIIIVGGIAFYISDPFNSRVKEQYDQMTKWTPENIAKDPKGYLDFCEQQTKKAQEDLKADEIRLAQSRAKLEQMRDDAAKHVTNGESALKEVVPMFTSANQSNSFPMSYRNTSYTKEMARKQIVMWDRDVERQKTLKTKAESGLKRLEAEAVKIEDLKIKAKEQLADIDYNRQLLAANKLTEDLKTRLVNMQAAVQATVNAASSTDGTISLSELTAETTTTVDEGALDKALDKYK